MRILYIFFLQVFIAVILSGSTMAASYPTKISVDNLSDSGTGSLRAALDTANKYIGPDTIIFSVTGQIVLSTPLTSFLDTVVVDATTAPGYAGIPVVSVYGSGISFYGTGASNSALKGLHIDYSSSTPVYCYTAHNLTISGCYILTNFLSTNKDDWGSYSYGYGIELQNCNNPTIGGTGLNDPNVIDAEFAISLQNCQNGKILKNYIGANRSGSMPGGSMPYPLSTGIQLTNGTSNILIDGNAVGNYAYAAIAVGVSTSDPVCQNNIIQNNSIGVVADNSPIPNGSGINVVNGSNNTIIHNTIMYSSGNVNFGSSGEGIVLSSASISDKISQNIISCNNGGNIVLNSGNANYAAPVFSDTAIAITATTDAETTQVTGKAQPFDTVEIFSNPLFSSCPYPGLSFDSAVVANASGDWTFAYHGTMPALITASATSPASNNTSAYSTIKLKNCSPGYAYNIYLSPTQTACTGTPVYMGVESYNNYGGYSWTTNGSGKFDNPTQSNPKYIPGPSDTTTVIVTIFATGIGPCPVYYQKDTITFQPSPTANAGPDQHVCSSSPTVTMAGKLSHSPSGTWSTSGSGSFIDNSILNTLYNESPGDTSTTYIEMYLDPASNGNGCSPIRDTVLINFDHNNKVSFITPTDTTICSNTNLNYSANSTSYGYSKLNWKTSGTGTFNYYSFDSLSVWYYQSPKDTVSKSVVLTLVSDNGTCAWDSAKATLRFRPAAVAITGVSGSDTLICNTNTLKLNGAVYNTSKFHWSTNGAGSFIPNDSSLSVTYVPDPSDWASPLLLLQNAPALTDAAALITEGSKYIRLVTDTTLGCPSSSSSFYLSFATPPNADSIVIGGINGSQLTACQGLSINLNATYHGDDTGYTYQWTTKGSGQFTSLKDSSAVYQPTDLDNRKVLVPFTVAMTGVCYTSKDIQAIILPLPDVGVGTQEQICPEDNITLTATAPGIEQAGYWTLISGTGKFADSTNSNGQITSISESINIYRWTISDSSTGCINHTDYTVYKCYAPSLEVYNAVSPNNDGMHDFLEIDNIDAYKDNNVIIYNRWGEKVFEMDNYNNRDRVFTGISNVNGANELPIGPYYYQIKINNKISKGYLVLRR